MRGLVYTVEFFADPHESEPCEVMTHSAESPLAAKKYIRGLIWSMAPVPGAWQLRNSTGRLIYREELGAIFRVAQEPTSHRHE